MRHLHPIALLLLFSSVAWGDPCGMVPPVYVGDQTPIARVGDQQTYVFYSDDVESFVIRPGFTGKVDEFGMLIPFPKPPALRKVSDAIFPHIQAAIDPPEVVVDLRPRRRLGQDGFGGGGFGDKSGLKFKKAMDEVRVLREEAVGMYDVAVLEAGSAAALKRWMDDKGYVYPKGMDDVCDEYVEEGWCFVAVKTRVGQKAGVDPRPGQRDVESKLPPGSSFDGHVQAMGFRFETDELVVPMRLSAFNEGELHNVVYLLTDGPRKIRSIPEEYVVRQLPGADLHRNVTGLLPLRIIGGTEKDLTPEWLEQLNGQRDPAPKNGHARGLFASDLLAIREDRLSNPHEEKEKTLLRIGERLGLRGAEIDAENTAALAEESREALATALKDVEEMTLTVVDGDFPREVLAGQNLTFAAYKMPSRRNSAKFYDAKTKKPAAEQPGVLKLGALRIPERSSSAAAARVAVWGAFGFGLLALGLVWARRRRAVGALALSGTLLALGAIGQVSAQEEENKRTPKSEQEILALIDQLDDAEKANDAVDALVATGEAAVPHLIGEAVEGESLTRRGWAIACLSEIGGEEVAKRMAELAADGAQPPLIRTWAAAARIQQADSTEKLVELAPLVHQFPAVKRPLGMRLVASLGDKENPTTAEQLLSVAVAVPQLQQTVAPALLARPAEELATVMAKSENQQIANRAAAYLGTMANQGDESVPAKVVEVYKFDPEAKQVPWRSGALWLPGLNWNQHKEQARELVDNLIRWYLWAELHDKKDQQNQINNNIRSLNLASAAGYQSPGFGPVTLDQWLTTWGKAVGKEGLADILEQQGVSDMPRYQKILDSL